METEGGRREGDQNNRGEIVNPFYPPVFRMGGDQEGQTGANKNWVGEREDWCF